MERVEATRLVLEEMKLCKLSSRPLDMQAMEEYRFEDQDASPLDCAAAHCSTASLVATVDVHPAPINRGLRTAKGLVEGTLRRRKTRSFIQDLNKIERVGNEAASEKIPLRAEGWFQMAIHERRDSALRT